MELGNFLFFIFASIGMTHIIVEGEIFRSTRDFFDSKMPKFLSKLINCYQCTGFWSGLAMGCVFILPQLDLFILGKIFAAGCASSCLSYFWAMFLTYIEANTSIKS
jgi:hypothetical protein